MRTSSFVSPLRLSVAASTRSRRLFPLNLKKVLDGAEDYSLRQGDRLIVLGGDDIRYLSTTGVQEIVTRRARIDRSHSSGPEASSASQQQSTGTTSAVATAQELGLSQLLGQQASGGLQQQADQATGAAAAAAAGQALKNADSERVEPCQPGKGATAEGGGDRHAPRDHIGNQQDERAGDDRCGDQPVYR